ncbi:MAG TPA: LysM peptidoglycan-binding domain-containing protein [Phycisphaerae bacterium]|nr:LysM peptidoglycan-binding domain-containing protein [Phycisphaerae bacterium]
MTTETRVGIVAGLMIVVSASVYFFYGSDTSDDSILVSTPTRVSLPPKIPPAADRPPKVADKTPAAPQRVARSPRRTPTAQSTDQLAQSTPPMRPIRPTAQPTQPAVEIASAAKASDSPIVLRTAPSLELVEATRENLRENDIPNSDDPPANPKATPISTVPQPLPRGAPMVVSRTPEVVNISPTPASDSSSSSRRPSLREMPESMWSSRTHTVSEGDTLSDISKQHFGDTSRVDDILAANPHVKSARHLKIGDVLTLPASTGSTARAASPAAALDKTSVSRAAAPDPNVRVTSVATMVAPPPSRTYIVQTGDTLYSIARKQYGSSKRWEDIFRLNKAALKNNPARLSSGMALKLPE